MINLRCELFKQESERIRLKNLIREKLGETEISKSILEMDKNRSTNKQIDNFIQYCSEENSPFKPFLEMMDEKQFCELAINFLTRDGKERLLYDNLTNLNSATDFKNLLFKLSPAEMQIDDIFSKYPVIQKLTSINFIGYMDEITQEYLHIFKSISFTYEDVLDLLDINDECFSRYVKLDSYCEENGMRLKSAFFLEGYMEFVAHIVLSTFFVLSVHSSLMSYKVIDSYNDEIKIKQQKVQKELKQKMDILLIGMEDIKKFTKSEILKRNLNYVKDDQILQKIAYHFQRKTRYQELNKHMEILSQEIEKSPEKFDAVSVNLELSKKQEKYIKKAPNLTTKDMACLMRSIFTEGKPDAKFGDKFERLAELLIFARDIACNHFTNPYLVPAIYREIYIIKSKSPILNVQANNIVSNLISSKENYKIENYINSNGFINKMKIYQEFRFLDCCFLRGYMSLMNLSHIYDSYRQLLCKIWDIILDVYQVADEFKAIELLYNISEKYIKLLSLLQKEEEP